MKDRFRRRTDDPGPHAENPADTGTCARTAGRTIGRRDEGAGGAVGQVPAREAGPVGEEISRVDGGGEWLSRYLFVVAVRDDVWKRGGGVRWDDIRGRKGDEIWHLREKGHRGV